MKMCPGCGEEVHLHLSHEVLQEYDNTAASSLFGTSITYRFHSRECIKKWLGENNQ